jgi:hypothetical protein
MTSYATASATPASVSFSPVRSAAANTGVPRLLQLAPGLRWTRAWAGLGPQRRPLARPARHPDGSLQVEHLGHGGRIMLPGDYVARDVELLYATTAHRVQGGTVDTAHPSSPPA